MRRRQPSQAQKILRALPIKRTARTGFCRPRGFSPQAPFWDPQGRLSAARCRHSDRTRRARTRKGYAASVMLVPHERLRRPPGAPRAGKPLEPVGRGHVPAGGLPNAYKLVPPHRRCRCEASCCARCEVFRLPSCRRNTSRTQCASLAKHTSRSAEAEHFDRKSPHLSIR